MLRVHASSCKACEKPAPCSKIPASKLILRHVSKSVYIIRPAQHP
ncbi:hypothetical protein HMPREF0762_01613 [Slackia exigua ATCC 700122]|uniref:Uncharacterized protein n=1 Tax=Slackia exigua (strain ATCC 700122 / DSM 15923 / CIP 105133 / JCM 11022 / KCTC 5966 / S-7) TaxID=649764 RepID=D0WID7_SLAES|nr:hypothetical protein HMPREF0762_01613 [Slackia exigua ATCC 700122]